MVRVIAVHHFSKQDVSACPAPTASALAGASTLVVATENQHMEVRELGVTPTKLSHAFQTVDRVAQIVYSPVGKYLATLEGDGEGSGVRIYVNWQDPSVNGAPIRPRIAGHVGPSSVTSSDDLEGKVVTLDMIEFPQRDAPLRIAVCESTGNLLVAAANLVIIYKFSVKTSKGGNGRYIDFHECFHIFHNFIPREVSLCEDVVGFLSESEVHIFKIKITTEQTHMNQQSGFSSLHEDRSFRSISVYSFTSESEPSSIAYDPWSGVNRRGSVSNGSEDTESEREYVSKAPNVTLKRQQDSETSEFHLEGGYGGNVKRHSGHVYLNDPSSPGSSKSPFIDVIIPEVEAANREFASMIGGPRIMEQTLGPTTPPSTRTTTVKYIAQQALNGDSNPRSGDFEADCVTLVHAKLLPGERDHDGFKNLNIHPVYWREFKVRRAPAHTPATPNGNGRNAMLHPLQSPFHVHLMSLTACFTSQNEGYLYHLPGHLRKAGKGCGVQKIATYPFTSPVGKIALESTLMHALTESGLATYTLRSGFHTVLEAEKVNNRTSACPLNRENPICLIGLRPFLGARQLLVSSSHLVILAQNGAEAAGMQRQLTKAPLVTSADEDNSWTAYSLTLPTSIDVHNDMMSLANMNKAINPQGYYQLLCEAHMVLRTSMHQLGWAQATKSRDVSEEEVTAVRDKYRDTCRQLAEYFVLSEEQDEWRLSLPYFRMSATPIPEVVKKVKELWEKEAETKKKTLPLPPALVHYVKEVILHPTPSENGLLDSALADQVIQLFGDHSMGTLANLVVKSPGFRGFKTNKIFEYFNNFLKTMDETHKYSASEKAEIILAFIILSVELGRTEGVSKVLAKASGLTVPFSELLIDNHALLLETSTSPDGICADSFSELALLIRDGFSETFMEVLVSLVKGDIYSLSTVLALFIGSFVSMSNIVTEAASNAASLQLFLETYFAEVLVSDSVTLDSEQEQAAQTLARSYMTSLSVPG